VVQRVFEAEGVALQLRPVGRERRRRQAEHQHAGVVEASLDGRVKVEGRRMKFLQLGQFSLPPSSFSNPPDPHPVRLQTVGDLADDVFVL